VIRVLASKYDKNANARNSLSKGDKAIWHGKQGNSITVTIDSDPMRHPQAPGDGMGYECIFHDTGERAFAAMDQLEIIRPDDYNSMDAMRVRGEV
jgi:hypothetical protein